MSRNREPDPYAELIPPQETPEQTKARLYQWHSNAGTMGVFYSMYPDDCPSGYHQRSNGYRLRGEVWER
jgi:hypothetical protein